LPQSGRFILGLALPIADAELLVHSAPLTVITRLVLAVPAFRVQHPKAADRDSGAN
jgi:hypothetical protein